MFDISKIYLMSSRDIDTIFIQLSQRRMVAVSGYRCTANELSGYIVDMCLREGHPISNLQLQKILYFCQLEYLRKTGSFLFDDDLQAWKYGPVIPSVYRRYSIWGGKRINFHSSVEYRIPNTVGEVIDGEIRLKRAKEPWELVDETHKPGSAWSKVYKGGLGDGDVITKELLVEAAQHE